MTADDSLADSACKLYDNYAPFCFPRLPGEWSCCREPLPCRGLQSSTHRSQLSSQPSSHSSTPLGCATVMPRRYFSRGSGRLKLCKQLLFFSKYRGFFFPSLRSIWSYIFFENVSLQRNILKDLKLRSSRCCNGGPETWRQWWFLLKSALKVTEVKCLKINK